MWRSVVLASVALMFGCGSHHEAVPSERTRSAGSQQLPADAGPVPDGVPPIASTAAADGTVEKAPAKTPTTATPHRPTDEAQCSGIATRCMLRVTAKGIYVDGDPKSRDEAVAACKRTVCALVALEDNAPAGEWEKLQAALRRAGIPILMRGVVNDTECLNNPLAKGCN